MAAEPPQVTGRPVPSGMGPSPPMGVLPAPISAPAQELGDAASALRRMSCALGGCSRRMQREDAEGGCSERMQREDVVWTPSSVPGSQCMARARLALATLLGLPLSAIPSSQVSRACWRRLGFESSSSSCVRQVAAPSCLQLRGERRRKTWPGSGLTELFPLCKDSRTPLERFKSLDDPQDPTPPSPCLTAPRWKPKNILETALALMELQDHNFCDANKPRQNTGADG